MHKNDGIITHYSFCHSCTNYIIFPKDSINNYFDMSFNNIYDIEDKQYSNNLKYRCFHNHENYPNDCFTFCRPTKAHYVRYLIRKIWSDKKLRLFLIVSILILKAIMVLTIIFIIPAISG